MEKDERRILGGSGNFRGFLSIPADENQKDIVAQKLLNIIHRA